MKKSLFLFATAALMLAACSSEDDIVQSGGSLTQLGSADAVGFDVYTPAATNVTKAGLQGTMTTSRLQRSEANGGGFGVYAYLVEDAEDDATVTAYTSGNGTVANVPNFMANEKILWNNTNSGWYYSPLKYWPNETNNDSQTTPAYMENSTSPKHLDRLTFFAYAPYVAADDASGTGIIRITSKAGLLNTDKPKDPSVEWKATTADATFNPNEGVDLLWGVAPAGGLSYTAVNGETKTVNEGEPLVDMTKPDVNTSMKFLFQHALARFGVNVVAAIDQVSPGGELDPNTRITINKFTITGPFGTTGVLNLNNDGKPGVANWTKINSTEVATAAPAAGNSSITVTANDATPANNYIAENLRWAKHAAEAHTTPVAQNVVGVTTAKQDLLAPSTKWFNKLAAAPAYNPGKKYVNENGTEVHASYTFDAKSLFYTLVSGHYEQKASGSETAPDFPAIATTNDYYTLTKTGEYIDQASKPASLDNDTKMYTRSGSGTALDPYVYTYSNTASAVTWDGAEDYYTVEGTKALASDIPFTYTGDIYEAERNYLYVVPTNAALDANYGTVIAANEASMRTITVQIEYYINTKDDKLEKGFAETKNVITKEVVLPSLANGKTYMLNAVLGLTSVKIEAEVSDWKVENAQVDLPQNTAE